MVGLNDARLLTPSRSGNSNGSAGQIRELIEINAAILEQDVAGFREGAVVCVDRLGRTVKFSAADDVSKSMEQLLSVFAEDFCKAADYFSLSVTFAKCFYTFIAIHPFNNGNRRTVIEFLKRRANDRNYTLHSAELLSKMLFEGNVADELRTLSLLFTQLFRPSDLEPGPS